MKVSSWLSKWTGEPQPTARVTASCVASSTELADQLRDVCVTSKNLLFAAGARSMCSNVETNHTFAVLATFLHERGFDPRITHLVRIQRQLEVQHELAERLRDASKRSPTV